MGTMQGSERSVWLADVIEADDKGTPRRVRVTAVAPEDVQGQGLKYSLRPEDQDVEGQGKRSLGQSEEDVEGHFLRKGLRPEDEDVEGQGLKWGGLFPTEDDAKGQVLVVGEGIPATQDIAGKTFRVEDEATEGQGVKRV